MKRIVFRIALLLSVLCLIATVAVAQVQRPLTPSALLALQRASDVQMANDGRRVAFVVTSWDRGSDRFNADLWTVMADQYSTAQRLTFHPQRDEHPRWSPNGQRIAFLSDRDVATQIFAINAQGGEAQQLTRHPSPILAFEWSPDGRSLLVLAAVPAAESTSTNRPRTKPPIVVDEVNPATTAQLWLLDVETQQLKQLTKGTRHITGFTWSFDGTQIAFTARQTPKLESAETTEVFLLPYDPHAAWPLETAQARQLTNGNGAESQPRFAPDGRWLAWLARVNGASVGPEKIHLFPLGETAEGAPTRVLAREFDGYIRNFRWLYTGGELVFSAGVGVNEQLFRLDLSDRPPQALTRNDGVCASFAASFDGSQLVYSYESTRVASELAGLNARTLLPQQLTNLNPQANELTLGQVETIKWRASDNALIEGLLVYPVGYDSTKRYPLMTYLHGGPESAVTNSFQASWSAPAQLLANQGYAVFLPNFRGSSNYGATFAQANTLKAGQIDFDDVMTGIDALIKRGVADGERLAIGGWSYGGYLSAWAIGQTNRFKCAVYGAGLSNAVSYWGTADITAQRERLHGGTPWTARKLFDEQSPLTYLPKAKTPTLIFHGERDDRVPLSQSSETYRTLKRLGTPVQLIIYPEQGHSLLLPSYQQDKLERELQWLAKHLQ